MGINIVNALHFGVKLTLILKNSENILLRVTNIRTI
jgi:hypothetical protein